MTACLLWQKQPFSPPLPSSRTKPQGSLTVFGNGRTHTGEVVRSGGSRLANYYLRTSPLSKYHLRKIESTILNPDCISVMSQAPPPEWVTVGIAGWGEIQIFPPAHHSLIAPDASLIDPNCLLILVGHVWLSFHCESHYVGHTRLISLFLGC